MAPIFLLHFGVLPHSSFLSFFILSSQLWIVSSRHSKGGRGSNAAVVVLLAHEYVAVITPVSGPGVFHQPVPLAVELAITHGKNGVIQAVRGVIASLFVINTWKKGLNKTWHFEKGDIFWWRILYLMTVYFGCICLLKTRKKKFDWIIKACFVWVGKI